MGIDFSDLIPAKPQASSATTGGTATGGISFEDLIPKQSEAATGAPSAVEPSPEPSGQSPGAAVASAGMQGLVGGTGQVVAGIGRQATSAATGTTQRQLAVMDAIDRGETVPDQQDPLGYQYLADADRAKARADLTGAAAEQAKHEPNLLERGGAALEKGAQTWFPVDPQQEGYATNIARGVGGFVPAFGAGALGGLVGGPVGGMLAANAAVGAQTYDETYQDQIAHGATHEQADKAAGEAAETSMAIGSVVPAFGRLLRYIPVPQRAGFLKTAINLAADHVEFPTIGAANQFAQNYVASQTYDPGRSLFKDTGDAALNAFLAGKVIHGVGAGVARGAPVLADALRPGPRVQPADIANRVMGAPTIEGAITAATEAASGQQAAGAPAGKQPTLGDLFRQMPPSDGSGPMLTTASGAKHPYRYEVVEHGDLIPASGDLQPRDRAGRVASTGQIADIARTLDPELLHASPGPEQGAPTVDGNGVVLAGNGRTTAIRQAYAQGNADPYRAMIERHGFDTTGMSEPVLIRRLTQGLTPEEARQFAVESNVQTGQRMSGTEQAAVDARSLTPDLLSLYNPVLTGGATAAGNRDFVRQWVASLPQSERNSVMDAGGQLSADGARRLQGAMLAAGYGDKGTLGRALESTDDTTRNLTGALTDAAPAWAQLQARIDAGAVPAALNVAPALIRAVELVRQAREKGQSVADVLAQQDAFNPIDPVTAGFVRAFYNTNMTRQASRTLIAEVLQRYATEAGQASTGAGLFGGALPAVAPADILATVTRAARGEPNLGPEPTVAQQAQALGVAAPPARVTAAQVQRRDGVGGVEARRRAAAENAAAAAEVVNGWRRVAPDEPLMLGQEVATDAQGQQWVRADHAQPTEATGAQVSTQQEAQMGREDFLANRAQGELERLLAPPRPGDNVVHIPETKLTLAETTATPQIAWEQAMNRQEPAVTHRYTDLESHNADVIGSYVADTAESKQRVLALQRERTKRAQDNIQQVFGDPNTPRAPADPSPTLALMRRFSTDARQEERGAVNKIILDLVKKFYAADGKLKTDPYRLYGIGEHIKDLLGGVGDPETSSAARVLKRELTLIKNSLYEDIEGAAPGFARYRAEYERDSRQIEALEYLLDERAGLVSGINQRITPMKWFSFMRRTVEGREDPFNPASSLSEDQMDRLWAVTDHLKRRWFIDQGKPPGSWTAFVSKWMGNSARAVAHVAAMKMVPVVGNIGIQMVEGGIRKHNVHKDAERFLNPKVVRPDDNTAFWK